MTYVQPSAPHVNGVRDDLTPTKIETLKNQLVRIQEDFKPTYEQPVCDTFYLVVEHTKKHGDQATFIQLNGDTAEYILAYVEEVPPTEEGE
jgi:ferritin